MIIKSSYLRSSACCCACESSRVVSNFSWFGSRTMGVMMFILDVSFGPESLSVLSVEISGLRSVDALMRRDAIAGHRLPHAQLEELHIQRMQKVGADHHRISNGRPASARGQRRAHAVLGLDGVEPHRVGDQRA